jgi:hypothetical protein
VFGTVEALLAAGAALIVVIEGVRHCRDRGCA